MPRYSLLILISIFSILKSYGQEDYEYVGALKLNDTAVITYKIAFNEKDGLIKGYSTTGIGGDHETKSFISGYFDDAENTLNFYESGILYTKSPITQDDFCYVHFEGKLRKMNENQRIQGDFKGLYSDGSECINGALMLTNFRKVLKRTQKMEKKISRSILISKEKKEKINLQITLDSLQLNIIRKDQVMSVFSPKDHVEVIIYDAGQEDGDIINLRIDGKKVLTNYRVTKTPKKIPITLVKKSTNIKITAISDGKIGGNTVKVDIVNNGYTIETLTSLKSGESTELVFLKK